jgi:hypothetical protein
MKMNGIIMIAFLLFVGCQEKDERPSSILGNWNIKNIYEDGIIIPKEIPNDSITLMFLDDGTIKGNSYRNLLLGHYKILYNDSIWISTIGGTEVNKTNWEKKFIEIMPMMTSFEVNDLNELVLYSEKYKIVFIKQNE